MNDNNKGEAPDLKRVSFGAVADMLAEAGTPTGRKLSDLLLDEAERFLDNVSMARITEGKGREANKARARNNAVHILVTLAKIWGITFDESICDMLQASLIRKGTRDP